MYKVPLSQLAPDATSLSAILSAIRLPLNDIYDLLL